MKLMILLFCFLAVCLIIPSNAYALHFTDDYYGIDDHGYGDVIGNVINFGIDYNITNAQDSIQLTEDIMPSSGWIYRNGQEVSIDLSDLTAMTTLLGNAGYDSNSDFIMSWWDPWWDPWWNYWWNYWSNYWGNPVIFHRDHPPGAPVPEPATMLLLGSGLIGLAVVGRRKLKKADRR